MSACPYRLPASVSSILNTSGIARSAFFPRGSVLSSLLRPHIKKTVSIVLFAVLNSALLLILPCNLKHIHYSDMKSFIWTNSEMISIELNSAKFFGQIFSSFYIFIKEFFGISFYGCNLIKKQYSVIISNYIFFFSGFYKSICRLA